MRYHVTKHGSAHVITAKRVNTPSLPGLRREQLAVVACPVVSEQPVKSRVVAVLSPFDPFGIHNPTAAPLFCCL